MHFLRSAVEVTFQDQKKSEDTIIELLLNIITDRISYYRDKLYDHVKRTKENSIPNRVYGDRTAHCA
jgi:hypothetical protein